MEQKPIREILKECKFDREFFHDLVQYRVREILLVSTIYDAYILEREGELTEQIFGEYYKLNLSTAPRMTSVQSEEEALNILQRRGFDLVILMMHLEGTSPFELSQKIKSKFPDMPVLLLLKTNTEIHLVMQNKDKMRFIDKVFVWNGDSQIFLAMNKYIEDKINVYKDTRIGMVRVILLVEDSIRYYSRYLPILYTEIIRQTQKLMAEKLYDEMEKLLRMRARPKVIMVENYEEAIETIDQFKEYLLCIITDAKFPCDGKVDSEAGIKLIRYVRKKIHDLPILLQSSEISNLRKALKINASFLDKHSESLSSDLTDFIFGYLGFGDFVFKDSGGAIIARARSMEEFQKLLTEVPDESLLYHARSNHFSAWLMARGEVAIAKRIHPMKVSDFPSATELRHFLIQVSKTVQYEQTRGKIVHFDESGLGEKGHIIQLVPGSLGGKGRGIAFANLLVQKCSLPEFTPSVSVKIPQTAIVGTEEFDTFIGQSRIQECIQRNAPDEYTKRSFLTNNLTSKLQTILGKFLKHSTHPLAVRSSGLFEDSVSQPFSGIYPTFLVPNNHPNPEVRLQHLTDAIKLIYASVYAKTTRAYFEAINYSIEEEKMAVIIQEAVGNTHESRFYPHFSGTAQSYNYYPFSYIKPEDGNATIALGLGKYVAEGGHSFRFCPKYPKLDMTPPEEQRNNTQRTFFCIDLTKNFVDLFPGEDVTLIRIPVQEAESDGVLAGIASTWDIENKRIRPGLHGNGPRLINFRYILRYNAFPLASVLEFLLELMQTALGTPVEIEFAVDLTANGDRAPTFYILQIKHLMRYLLDTRIETDTLDKDTLFLYTEQGMGNGKLTDIHDIIYIDPATFDKSKTEQISSELEHLNEDMKKAGRKYILIGPGRWGTRDRWLGIPVNWTQISHAQIIVEMGLDDFRVEPSLGSHFFHTMTTMNIGYFTIPYDSEHHFIDWDWLKTTPTESRTDFCVHKHFNKPLSIVMDGRQGISVIYK